MDWHIKDWYIFNPYTGLVAGLIISVIVWYIFGLLGVI